MAFRYQTYNKIQLFFFIILIRITYSTALPSDKQLIFELSFLLLFFSFFLSLPTIYKISKVLPKSRSLHLPKQTWVSSNDILNITKICHIKHTKKKKSSIHLPTFWNRKKKKKTSVIVINLNIQRNTSIHIHKQTQTHKKWESC